MAKTFASIDVGTSKVCSIVANVGDEGAIQILGVGVVPSRGVNKGLVVNIDEAKEAIRESVMRAEHISGLRIESAYVGVTGRHISSLNKHSVVATTRSDQRVTADDLDRVLESARSITIPSDRRLLHIIPRYYVLDDHVVVKEPVGMHGFRLDVETHIVTAAAASVRNLIKSIRGVGVEIDNLVLSPLAAGEIVLSADERNAGVILADIGAGTTDVAIFREGCVWHSAILPVGGYQVTRDIAMGLGVLNELAEEMKKKYGNLMTTNDVGSDYGELDVGTRHTVSYRELNDIIRVRVEEILQLIMMEVPRGEWDKLAQAGLVLTGGTANIPGIDLLAREVLNMQHVRVGLPSGITGITDTLHDPASATSVGLLFWGANHEGKDEWRMEELRPGVIGAPSGTVCYPQGDSSGGDRKDIEGGLATETRKEEIVGKTDFDRYQAKIRVVGVGGGGCNALNRMIQNNIQGVEFIAINTDAQDLDESEAKTKLQIGTKLTKGLGAGGDQEMGRKAAEESRDELADAIRDTDLLFITAGMGGGTGTGAAPVIAQLGKKVNALVIGIVTRPFGFEGSVRDNKAEEGITNLIEHVDTLIAIPNDRLLSLCDHRLSVDDAFTMADEILRNGVQSIAELITVPGLINLDFADVKTIMSGAGQAWIAIGKGHGPNRAADAARAAITSPLLDVTITGATRVLLNFSGGNSLTLAEVHEAAEIIRNAVDPEANIIFGVAHDAGMNDDIRITLIATGFPRGKQQVRVRDKEEMRQKLAALKEEDKLDTPTFLRHPLPPRRQAVAFPSKVIPAHREPVMR